MTNRLLSRRQVLFGAGGFSLALPFLPSLAPRRVAAQAEQAPRRFVALATDHGAVSEDAMFPPEAWLTETQNLYADHSVRRGALQLQDSGGRAALSTILTASSDVLTPELVTRMNVLRGLDIPFYIAHHTGGHLGNYARNDGNGEEGQAVQPDMMPTIDQIMAWSESFYGSADGLVERAMVMGEGSRLSWSWSSPQSRAGTIQEVTVERDPSAMFRRIFIPEEDVNEVAARPPIVDRVLESYRSLRESDRRLSSADRQRLDDHLERLAELQRRLESTPVRAASCSDVQPLEWDGDFDPATYHRAINDVIVAAFLCDTSRIAVVKIHEASFVSYEGDWHQEVAHEYSSSEPQRLLREANQLAFEHAVVDLASKLNVEEWSGQTLLDSTLLQWSQESGEKTHDARSLPVITFGGAGGGIRTGQYCDYRKLTESGRIENGYGGNSGLLYAQWLAQALRSVGVSREEFQNIEHNAPAGYGHPHVSADYARTHSAGVVENASEPLPFLT